MKKYEAYKNSGIEWIGEVPKKWKPMRFKHFVNQITTASTHPHKIALENIESKTGKFVSTDSEFEGNGVAFNVDDVVYGKLRPYLQKVWKAEFEGNAVGDFFVYRAKDNCLPSYLKYVMLSDNFTSAANGSTYGAKMPRVASEFIANSVWFLPSLSEQHGIAFYLDYKAGQIDASISAINTQIDDMKSYRQSIISEAVTKGLNPNVPMKDSGVDWIGEIPEGWSLSRIKFETDMVLGKMLEYKEPKNNNGSYTLEPYLKSRNIGMLKVFNDIEQLDRMWFNDKEKTQYELKDGDLVMNEGGDIGKVSLWKDPGFKCYIQNSVHKITPHRDVLDSTYLQYLVSIITSKGYFNTVVSSISIAHLTKEKLAETPILLPPLSEQQTIASYLDSKTSKIDATIASLESQRDDLNALKQSIISEAVTGKIDVRDWKPNK